MTPDRVLGPLWDNDPKSEGALISIPHPEDIYYKALQMLEVSAELSQLHINKINTPHGHFDPYEIEDVFSIRWEAPVDDGFMSQTDVLLYSRYTEENGPDIYMSGGVFTYNELVALEINDGFTDIVESLREDFEIEESGYDEKRECNSILMRLNGEDYSVTALFTGATAEEPSITLWLDKNLEIRMPEFLSQLRTFQSSFSFFIDHLYKSANLKPANFKMVLHYPLK